MTVGVNLLSHDYTKIYRIKEGYWKVGLRRGVAWHGVVWHGVAWRKVGVA